MNGLLQKAKECIEKHDGAVKGLILNCGESAGQTVMHTHMHLIPRRDQEVPSPKGGIRNVIPGKGGD